MSNEKPTEKVVKPQTPDTQQITFNNTTNAADRRIAAYTAQQAQRG